MAQQNNKVNERNVGEYKVPEDVYNANWRDDVEQEAKEQDSIRKDFEFFDNEASYDSRRNVVIDADKIKRFQMAKRIRRLALRSS